MVCTFFGHKNAPDFIYKRLEYEIINLIENEKVDTFYVGNNGQFDYMARNVLESITKKYKQVNYSVVLAYLPQKNNGYINYYGKSVYPDGLENTPPKYAIIKRNDIMLNKADIVITYVTHGFGGAALFKEKALKKGKKVIELG